MALEHSIRLYRGNFANLPTTGLAAGMPLVTMDRKTAHIATDATTTFTLTPAIELLTTLSTVTGSDDFVMIHDASEASGQKEKKMTFNAFKTALNIPDESTDELVAVTEGGQAGYIWNTDGTDGIFRMGTSLEWSKDGGNAFVTIGVADLGIDTAQLAADAVTTGKIDDLAVTTGKIDDLAVTEGKIAGSAVTTTKINNGAVTNGKLAANALNLNTTTFEGNGVTTELDIAVVDGGTF